MAYRKVLITGCEGQLGHYLFHGMKNLFNVLPTSKLGSKKNNIYKLDITNIEDVNIAVDTFKPDILINTAAITNVDYCENNKTEARNVNVNGLFNLIKSVSINTRIIHFSSDYVFDGKQQLYSEESLPNPVNFYGRTKLESENLLIGQRKAYVIVRPNTIYSLRGINFFNWVYNQLKSSNTINIVDDQISNPSYIPSIIKSIVDMIVMNARGIYHHGSVDYLSRYEFCCKISNKFNFNHKLINKIKTKELNQSAERPKKSCLSIDKIEKDFNLKMNYTNDSLDDLFERLKYE